MNKMAIDNDFINPPETNWSYDDIIEEYRNGAPLKEIAGRYCMKITDLKLILKSNN